MSQIGKMRGIRAMFFSGCTLLVVLAAAAAMREDDAETTVILVRHAEKAMAPGDDPALSEAGRKRADALRRVLEKADVSAIYATQYQRTQQTVEPLAKALKIPVTKMEAAGTEKLVAQIRQKHGGETVLVAGHSNTVPEIMKALGVGQPPTIGDGDFDNLFVVTISKTGPSRLLHLQYGKDN